MGFKAYEDVFTRIPADTCFRILQGLGARVDKYSLLETSPKQGFIVWRKGWGWTNPIQVRVDVKALSPTQTKITFTADLLAAVDPLGFTKRAIELFKRPVMDQIQRLEAQEPATTAPANDPPRSIADEIRKLAALKADGILSEDEFTDQKSKLLKRRD